MICVFLGLAALWPVEGLALTPNEILVIANRNVAMSMGLARYYMEKRKIPDVNLLELRTGDKEWCSREEYNKDVAAVVRQYLKENDGEQKIRCLVTMYGVPLKVNAPEISVDERTEVRELRQRRQRLNDQLKAVDERSVERIGAIRAEVADIQKRLALLETNNRFSALDSELALVGVDSYPLSGWVPNPLFLGFKNRKLPIPKKKVLMVSRLDGPDPEIVRRIIDDSVEVEKTGLSGFAYFDARWPRPDAQKKVSGYALYDKSIHLAVDLMRKVGRLTVVLDERTALFQEGQCPKAALYCGWYSLGKYVDAFDWVRGAVGYHIASSECTTLKKARSQVWCKRMLEEGVVATVGPTSEPYVQAFPVPNIFFGLLVDGQLDLAECYVLSTPFLSWQMVLIGDPLYRPFGGKPY